MPALGNTWGVCALRLRGGDSEAQYNLGISYFEGEGIPKDASEAVHWFRKAAEQGYAAAQYRLGISYLGGKGVPKDSSEGMRWLRQAAEQGHVEAYAWLNVAVAKVPRMKEFRDQWAKDMTPAQIAEAQALSREYWKAYGGSGD